MRSVVIPEKTELKSLEEKLLLLKDIQIIPSGASGVQNGQETLLDLTFDIFSRDVSEEYLYGQFSRIHLTLESLGCRAGGGSLTVLKNYPYKTNINRFLRFRRIVDSFVSFLVEFYNSRIIFIPSVISRHGFQYLSSPPVRLINAIRLDRTDQVSVRDASRFFLIYDMDILNTVFNRKGPPERDLVIEGIELSLRDIYDRASRIVGNTPIRFDQANFINFEYPGENSDAVSSLNYDLEDMVIDITSYLF